MNTSISSSQRIIFRRLSITAGNLIQIAGISAACVSLAVVRSSYSKPFAIAVMLVAWTLLYFSCHGIAHWFVGRILGIRFSFYTIGGTGNPQGYPAGMRWLFEHLPFFGVQTQKASMQKAAPRSIAIMWSAGVTSSALVPTLCAAYTRNIGIPGSKLFLIFAIFWAFGTLSSNWRSRTGDYAKARRALHAAHDTPTLTSKKA